MASQNLNVGTSANANDGDTLRAAFIKLKQMFAEVYGQTYSEQGDLSGTTFKIKESKLQMTTAAVAGDDGKVLTYDHASNGFTWEAKFDGDITGIVAGAGLTGDATSGDASLAVGAGDGISVTADAVALAAGVAGSGLTLTSGVLSVDTLADGSVGTDIVADDAITPTKTSVLDNNTAATSTHILVGQGSTFINKPMSGDATIAATGAITIADDAVTADKIANAVNTLISNNTAKVTNATHTGDVTGATALTIADDIITNAKLGVEYTTSVALTSGTNVAVDTALGDVFTMTAGASHTFNFTNVVVGDMKSLEITGSGGSYTSAFGTVNGSACTFNKIGGTYADTAAKQLIQIKWTAINVAWYQISPIAS